MDMTACEHLQWVTVTDFNSHHADSICMLAAEVQHTTYSHSQDLVTLAGGNVIGPLLAAVWSGGGAPGSPARGTSIRYTFFSQARTKVAEGACLQLSKASAYKIGNQLSRGAAGSCHARAHETVLVLDSGRLPDCTCQAGSATHMHHNN